MAKRTFSSQKAIALPDAEIDLIRFEKNLLQIGFFSSNDTRGVPRETNRRIEQWVNRDGKKIRVSAEFRSTLGLPSTTDRDKYMAFMKIAMDRRIKYGQLENPIRFSGYAMIMALGQSVCGAAYDSINEWGERMADTTITSEQIIYQVTNQKFMNKTVHVFRSFQRSGIRGNDGNTQSVQYVVELEDWLLENINKSYVIPEDFAQYRRLARPTAKGIFVYLNFWFFASNGKAIEKDYAELCQLLSIKCYQHLSKIKETIGKSLEDLVAIRYLASWDIQPMSSKEGYKLVLNPGVEVLDLLEKSKRRQLQTPTAVAGLTPEQAAAKAALSSRGIAPEKAELLSEEYDPAILMDQIEYLDQELKRDGGKRIKNPPGFIISFIEGGKSVPDSFESNVQRKNRLQAQEEESNRAAEAEILEMEARSRYSAWKLSHIDACLKDRFTDDELISRLREYGKELALDRNYKSLQFMQPEMRREIILKKFKLEIEKELNLCSFEEWWEVNSQADLFHMC
jgi:hypothetical protein